MRCGDLSDGPILPGGRRPVGCVCVLARVSTCLCVCVCVCPRFHSSARAAAGADLDRRPQRRPTGQTSLGLTSLGLTSLGLTSLGSTGPAIERFRRPPRRPVDLTSSTARHAEAPPLPPFPGWTRPAGEPAGANPVRLCLPRSVARPPPPPSPGRLRPRRARAPPTGRSRAPSRA